MGRNKAGHDSYGMFQSMTLTINGHTATLIKMRDGWWWNVTAANPSDDAKPIAGGKEPLTLKQARKAAERWLTSQGVG